MGMSTRYLVGHSLTSQNIYKFHFKIESLTKYFRKVRQTDTFLRLGTGDIMSTIIVTINITVIVNITISSYFTKLVVTVLQTLKL